MIRRPPRSTRVRSSAASDVYKRQLIDSDVIELDDLPPAIRGDHAAALGPSLRRNDTLRAWASRYVRLIVDRCEGNKREACRVLGISYHTLQAYLRFPIHETGPMESA